MIRAALVRLHRWAGLAIAGFLIVVGLTGSLLAFWNEINHWITPDLYPGAHAGIELDAATLARRAEALAPQARATQVYLGYIGTAWVTMEALEGAPPLAFDQIYLDTVTGAELGRLKFGVFPTRREEVMPFVYKLHYALALDDPGGRILGIVALVWTIDCFVAFALTLPRARGRSRKSFFARWKPALLVKWSSSLYRVNFDFHRAGGLWLWALLLIYAWSSVMMNLDVVYSRVTGFFLDYPRPDLVARPLPVEGRKPLEWEEALSIASRRMAEQAKALNFTIERPIALYHLRDKDVFNYRVRSSLDIGKKYGATGIDIDAYTGELLTVALPTGQHSGVTVSTWLAELHSANVFGPAYQVAVSLFGVTVAALSASGVYISWKKRRARGALYAPKTNRRRSTMSDVMPS
ncbi:PepSY-associated TM helix domain-containing protein [Methylosinus sporium]|uniref:PepSY-associated TM helix domain-containing protein n=1 Tax=Methylosinus sporium TaxID=428 RepID=UPI003839D55C